MGRGFRCVTVWAAVSLGCAAVARFTAADMAALGRAATWEAGFDATLVPVCSTVVGLCAAWFWCVTTVTVVEVLRGACPAESGARGGVARRVALVLCGAAVATQLATPATAVGQEANRPDGLPSLSGLSVPDRAVSGRVRSPRNNARPLARPGFHDGAHATTPGEPARNVVVRPGDSLWSLAEDALGDDADLTDLVDHWHRTYATNRHVVGADPDLIHPGQRLVLPPGQTTHHPSQSSDHEEHR